MGEMGYEWEFTCVHQCHIERSGVALLISDQSTSNSRKWTSKKLTTIISPITSCESPAIGGSKLEEGGIV